MRGPLQWAARCLASLVSTSAPAQGRKTPAAPLKLVAAAPPPMRVGSEVQPKAYALALALDPAQNRHRSVVDIDVQLRQPSARIHLHAKNLTVQQGWAEVGARRLDAKEPTGSRQGQGADRADRVRSCISHPHPVQQRQSIC